MQDEPAFTLVTFVTEKSRPGVQLDGVGGVPGGGAESPAPTPSPSGSPAASGPLGSGAAPRTDARTLPATGTGQLAVAGAMVLGGAVVARRFLLDEPAT